MIDEYYKLFSLPVLDKVAEGVTYIGGARHAVFFAMPMLLIGGLIALKEDILLQYRKTTYSIICILLFALGFVEATILNNTIGMEITTDVSLFGWTPSVPLLLIGLSTKSMLSVEKSRRLRKVTDVVYIIHVWVITIVQKICGFQYMGRFLMVVGISFIITIAFVSLIERVGKRTA